MSNTISPELDEQTFCLMKCTSTAVLSCDVSAILAELQALRSEIRNMRQLQDEVSTL